MVETLMDAPCPICGRKSLIYRAEELDLPYFGKCLQTTIICKNCGFRHADVMMLEVHEPMEYKVKIKEEKDLYIKVVRSTSGTLMIPEIDAKLEPGPLSEAFITNVEGVLNRFVDILVQLMHDTPEKKDDVLEILRKIGYIKHGRMEATLIIQDPLGNSAIISEKTEKRKLTEEEVKNLKLGEFVIDIKDLR
ncbi:hypothetical protein B6U71_01940 [Euryarchaeota archaeon ex4484_178]|nr:MAG: hypothetical protein B6U71_01940 [Euryarchaeota archaeon ex4484_178]